MGSGSQRERTQRCLLLSSPIASIVESRRRFCVEFWSSAWGSPPQRLWGPGAEEAAEPEAAEPGVAEPGVAELAAAEPGVARVAVARVAAPEAAEPEAAERELAAAEAGADILTLR